MAHVFISYRSKDFTEAARLRSALAAEGHEVWLDVENIKIGDSIVGKINAGLQVSSFLILCFSGHGLSPWMDREWMSSLERQLDGAGVRILPAKLAGGKPPPIIADLRYADLARDWASAIDELKAALR